MNARTELGDGKHSSPWRLRCPNGHASWRRRMQNGRGGPASTNAPYCREVCEMSFARLVDAKTGKHVR